MKKKKLKKILTESILEIKKKIDDDLLPTPIKEDSQTRYNDFMFSESSDEIREKSRKMFWGLLKFRDQLRININDNCISIHSESGFKKNQNNYLNTVDYFDLDIIKDTGFILNFKDKRLAFKDENIYQDVLSKVKETFTDLNLQNFDELYHEIMVDSGLARETNLNSLLD